MVVLKFTWFRFDGGFLGAVGGCLRYCFWDSANGFGVGTSF